jgi:hypothetical protein
MRDAEIGVCDERQEQRQDQRDCRFHVPSLEGGTAATVLRESGLIAGKPAHERNEREANQQNTGSEQHTFD